MGFGLELSFEGLAFLCKVALALALSFSMMVVALGVEPASSRATDIALEMTGA